MTALRTGDTAPRPLHLQSPPVVLYYGGANPCSFAVIQSFRTAGADVVVVEETAARDGRADETALPGAVAFDESLFCTAEGLQRIADLARRIRADALAGQSDDLLLWTSAHVPELPGSCRLLCPPWQALSRAQSKRFQIEMAQRVGLSVLPTYYLSQPPDAERVDPAHYPLVVRPSVKRHVEPRFKTCRVESAAGTRDLLSRSVISGEPLIGQPFRELPGLLVHGVNAVDGTCLKTAAFLVARKFRGMSLTVRPTTCPDPIIRRITEMTLAMGIVGPYHAELLYDPATGEAWHLDLNVRFGGTTDKVRRLGFDEAALTLRAFNVVARIGDNGPPAAYGEVVNKADVVKHLAAAALGRLSPLDYPQRPRWWHVTQDVVSLLCSMDSLFYQGDTRGYLKRVLRFASRHWPGSSGR